LLVSQSEIKFTEEGEASTKGREMKQAPRRRRSTHQDVYFIKNQGGEPPTGGKLQPTQSPR